MNRGHNDCLVSIKAGAAYATSVFLVGFVLGTVRVLFVVPRFGETLAVSLEAPIMVIVSWAASRWSAHQFAVPPNVTARAVMGAGAFVVLMLAEAVVAVGIFGRSLSGQIASYQSTGGATGLLAQIAFAIFPLVQGWLIRRSVGH